MKKFQSSPGLHQHQTLNYILYNTKNKSYQIHMTIDVAILTLGVARKLPPSLVLMKPTEIGRARARSLLRVTFYILRKRYFSARIIKKCVRGFTVRIEPKS